MHCQLCVTRAWNNFPDMKIKIPASLRNLLEYDIGGSKPAVAILATLGLFGTLLVFVLSNYGGEVGLITREEPRLAYLYCREELKSMLHLSDNSLFDNYLDASIRAVQPHQYVVRIRFNMSSIPGDQVLLDVPCSIASQPDGAWVIMGLNTNLQ